MDAGLRAAGEHHVRVVAPDGLERLSDRVPTRGAGRYGREVRAERAEADRNLAGADVRDAHWNEKRAQSIRATGREDEDLVEQGVYAAEPGTEDHARPLGELAFDPFGKTGLVHRLSGCDKTELDVAVGPTHLFAVQDVAGVEGAGLA